MSQLTVSERMRLSMLLADRTRRMAVSRALHSPLLRWRFGAPIADQLLIIPQDLRTADPSFWSEMRHGHFGFAGRVAFLDRGSPFGLPPPSAAWQRELHGFGWLRNLEAAADDAARTAAIDLVRDWITRHRTAEGIAWEPAVTGRRVISWLSQAGFLLDGIDPKTYDLFAESLGRQMVHLSAAWRHAPEGYPRLLSVLALVMADLSVAGHDRQADEFARAFALELSHQIHPDGGHVSRNPGVLVELLLDLLPLGQCFIARGREIPAMLSRSIGRMLPMLRYLRLGDGTLVRFNGMGAQTPDVLATVLVYADSSAPPLASAPHTRYARLERGPTIIVADVGPPPALALAAEAHAGCLSFEMTVGQHAVLVNGGAPGPADDDWRAAARATASHSTLCLADTSSSRLVRSRLLESLVGSPPIRGPERVEARTTAGADGGVTLEAFHDGYLSRFRLLHRRSLRLDATGRRLDGIDRLGPPKGVLRLPQDLPYAIHFHIHPEVVCSLEEEGAACRLEVGEKTVLRFAVEGREAALGVEESIHYCDISGPRRSLQIVLRGTTFGDTTVAWSLERIGEEAVEVIDLTAQSRDAPAPAPAPVPRPTPPPLPPAGHRAGASQLPPRPPPQPAVTPPAAADSARPPPLPRQSARPPALPGPAREPDET